MKIFRAITGQSYELPDNHCLFCRHCSDIFTDYTNGVYMWFCEYGEPNQFTCERFSEDNEEDNEEEL